MIQGRFLPLTNTTNSTGYRFITATDITDSIAMDFINVRLQTTSATSLTIGTGTISLTVGTGLSLYIGQTVTITYQTNQMVGTIVTYDTETGIMTVIVTIATGSGTYTSWTVVAISDSRVGAWLDLVDGEILSLAQEREVPLTSISIPLHKKIFEYAKSYFCFVCFQDAFGRNDIQQTDQETIKKKLEWYEHRCTVLRLICTKEMFLYTNLSLQASQRAGGTISILRA